MCMNNLFLLGLFKSGLEYGCEKVCWLWTMFATFECLEMSLVFIQVEI